MAIKLFNTLSKQKEDFVPNDPERVTMYVCGPTVYSYAHIGNARPAVVFDTLFRVLQHSYNNVVYARNITDVDDKINKSAKEQNVEISVITKKFADIYRDDMSAIGVQMPTIEPHATDHMPEIIGMIEKLIAGGHAYEAENHVLFDVSSYPAYGELSNRDMREMIAGARVEVAPYKRNPADFVLWKPSDDETPGWDSPWGRGRPGWHIECSAMIETHLGETIDIHGGGHDLQFPHHENEIAQGTCAHGGKTYCKYWMHNGFVNVESEKMSKSIGNVLLVHDLIEQAPGEAIRLALLTAHYRQPLDWSADGLNEAKKKLDRLYTALKAVEDVDAGDITTADATPEVIATLHDDLNTPKALAELFALAKAANTATGAAEKIKLKKALIGSGMLLGLLQQTADEWFSSVVESSDVDGTYIDGLIAAREQARSDKNWAEADRIRDELNDLKVVIEDGANGTTWRIGN